MSLLKIRVTNCRASCGPPRLVVVVALLALGLAVVLGALIGFAAFRHAEQRRQVRGAAHEHRGPAHGSSVSGASIQIAA